MNILILNWRDPKNPLSGGAEIVTMQHAKAWVKAGHKVTWFTSSFEKSKGAEIIDRVSIVRRGNSLTVFLFAPFFYLFSGLSFDAVIDEIHGIPFFTPFFVRKPKIVFIHEVAGEIWDYMYPFPINIVGKILEKFYMLIYKGMTFWTDAPSTVDELVEYGIPRKNCIAIPCPVSNVVGSSLKKEKKPTFIFVSRLVRMKGIEEIIKSFSIILKKQHDASLWIVGGGEDSYIKKLKELVKRCYVEKNVVFWGKVTDKKKLSLMSSSHILLHASVKEGWGLVVLEAASQGTPSVVYNVPGLRDSVKNNMTGIVIKENTPEEMARQALLLFKDNKKYKKFQSKGLFFVNNLLWSDITKQSLALIKKISIR